MSGPACSDLHADVERPLGLVLSGGGARGAFHVGVWQVLREHPRGFDADPLVVSGTSAGAINGALIAAGLSPSQMLDFWIDLGRRPPVVANDAFFRSFERSLLRTIVREPLRALKRRRRGVRVLGDLARKHAWHRPSGLAAALLEYVLTARYDNVSDVLAHVHAGYLFSTAPLRERLMEAIGGPALTHSRVRLAINAVDARTGGVVRFVNYPPAKHDEAAASHYRYTPHLPVDTIVASASIPLLFNTVRVAGMDLWDGGLLVNTPIAPAVALGARRIVPVLVTRGSSAPPSGPMDLGTGIERLADAFLENAYNVDRKLLLERNRIAEYLPERRLARVELFEAVRPVAAEIFDAGSYLYFSPSALRAMHEAGRRAAERWLAAGPRTDPRPRDGS